MEKTKEYFECRFSAEALNEAICVAKAIATRNDEELNASQSILRVEHDDSTWNYDTIDEFLADFRKYDGHSLLYLQCSAITLTVTSRTRMTEVSVKTINRTDIEAVFNIFEKNVEASTLKPIPKPAHAKPVVFIGHGRSQSNRG